MNKKPLIFFCDDKPKWTTQFNARHGERFDIRTTNNTMEFRSVLSAMIKQGEIPDIILIDLYHPNGDPNSDEQKQLGEEGQKAIVQLEEDIKKAKKLVLKAWNPWGYELLEQARTLCSDTPIAIYTEQGLTLADDDELERVSKSDGEWFMKGKTVFYENLKLEKMLPNQYITTKKPLVFYCDDKIKWTKLFEERHKRRYDIRTTNDALEFKRDLLALLKQGENPDIILIDLYHPNGDPNSDEQKELAEIGQKAIDQLNEDIEKAKGPITKVWNPWGYDMLEQARKLCPNTPIAIYTEQGLTLADDKELERVSKSNGEWFLKGKTAFYENAKLERMLNSIPISDEKDGSWPAIIKRLPKFSKEREIRVVIASPCDTHEERKHLLENMEHKFRAGGHEEHCGFRIIVSGWEELPSQNGYPQGVINTKLIGESDFVVAVFKHKLGTPTINQQTGIQVSESGTVEELSQALNYSNPKHPIGMLYFHSVAPIISLDTPDRDKILNEWDRLKKFKETISTKMIYKAYKEPSELLEMVLKDLEKNICDYIIKTN